MITLKECKAKAQQLGMRFIHDKDWEEYQVSRLSDKHRDSDGPCDSTYCTDDIEDAYNTMIAISCGRTF